MSLPRPNESYHFQANLIWWDSPFKCWNLKIIFRLNILHKHEFWSCLSLISLWEFIFLFEMNKLSAFHSCDFIYVISFIWFHLYDFIYMTSFMWFHSILVQLTYVQDSKTVEQRSRNIGWEWSLYNGSRANFFVLSNWVWRGESNPQHDSSAYLALYSGQNLKGVCHEIVQVLFWHVWIDLGLYKNLWLFIIFSVEPLILYLHLKFRSG